MLSVPNDFTRDWIEGHFLDLIGAAVRDAIGDETADPALRRARGRAARGPIARTRRAPTRPPRVRDEPEVHVRLVRDRLVEPVRARGRARGRGGAGAGVQPALHLRRHGSREDAPPPGDRPVRRRALARALRPLHHERDVHERLHQLAPRQADRGLQAALPHVRPAADRRHPVPRAQGADPGGVLPHLQLALRGRPADRDLLRPPAARDLDARGAPALAVRVGADHRHPAARPRDAHRDPAQEGEDGRDPRPRPAGADLHRRPRVDEHPRARGRPHAGRRLLEPDRRGR